MVKIEKIAIPMLIAILSAASAQAQSDDMILQNGKLSLTDDASRPAAPATNSLRVAGLWLVIFGAAAGGATLYFRRRTKATTKQLSSSKLTLVERLSLGNNRELLLVKACDRLLIVASQANQLSLISDLASDDMPADAPAFPAMMAASTESLIPRHMRAAAPAQAPVPDVSQVRDTVSFGSKWPEMEGVR